MISPLKVRIGFREGRVPATSAITIISHFIFITPPLITPFRHYADGWLRHYADYYLRWSHELIFIDIDILAIFDYCIDTTYAIE